MSTEFQKEKMEDYSHKELKQFCKDLGIATTGLSTKEDFKSALQAWVDAGEAPPPREDNPGPNGGPEAQLNPAGERPANPNPGRSPEDARERERNRLHELELARLKQEGEIQLAERKLALEQLRLEGDLEEKRRQRDLEEKKLMLEHERVLKELEFKTKAGETTTSGSKTSPPPVDTKVHIPKDVVKEYYKNDDIQQWFTAYEVAMAAHRVPLRDWEMSSAPTEKNSDSSTDSCCESGSDKTHNCVTPIQALSAVTKASVPMRKPNILDGYSGSLTAPHVDYVFDSTLQTQAYLLYE
ncbi:uncharacterized protein LOC144821952 [Lissotriton helveticus]